VKSRKSFPIPIILSQFQAALTGGYEMAGYFRSASSGLPYRFTYHRNELSPIQGWISGTKFAIYNLSSTLPGAIDHRRILRKISDGCTLVKFKANKIAEGKGAQESTQEQKILPRSVTLSRKMDLP
jgi:hypothetical protein